MTQTKENRVLYPMTDEVRSQKKRVTELNKIIRGLRRRHRTDKRWMRERKRLGFDVPDGKQLAELNRQVQVLVAEKKQLEQKLASWKRGHELALVDNLPAVTQACLDDYYRLLSIAEDGIIQAVAAARPEISIKRPGPSSIYYSAQVPLTQHWTLTIIQEQIQRRTDAAIMWGGEGYEKTFQLTIRVQHQDLADAVSLYSREETPQRLHQLGDEYILEKVVAAIKGAAIELLSVAENPVLMKQLALNAQKG